MKIPFITIAYVALPTLIVVSPLASVAADDMAGGKACSIPPSQPAQTCIDASCAARAKQELDDALKCHNRKMDELQAKATSSSLSSAAASLAGGPK